MSGYKTEKHWQHMGLDCVVIMTDFGFRCGFVGVPPESPFFGKGRDEMDFVSVHGGITSVGPISFIGENNLWWFKFDCAHDGDGRDVSAIKDPELREYYEKEGPYTQDTARSLNYCIKECEELAEQLIEKKGG